jgi:hypothetical protein
MFNNKLLFLALLPGLAFAQIGGSIINLPSGSSSIAFPQSVTGCVSGGVVYGSSSTTTINCSGLLTQYGIMYGGGSGAAPGASAQFLGTNIGTAGTEYWTMTNTGLGTTPAGGLQLYNSTAATNVLNQVSSPLTFCSYGWQTQATAGSVQVCSRIYESPQQARNAESLLGFDLYNSTGSYSQLAFLRGGTNLVTAGFQLNGTFYLQNSAYGFYEAGGLIYFFQGGSGFLFQNSSGTPEFTINSSGSYDSISSLNNILHLGAVDAAAPVAQTLGVQSVVAGTSNTAGANFTINGSIGTGNQAGGNIIFQVAPKGTSGSSQNTLVQILGLGSDAHQTVTAYGYVALPNIYSTGSGDVSLCQQSGGGGIVTYGSVCGTSLRSTKNNIAPLIHGLDYIMAMTPVTFNFKVNNEPDIGFIADDMAAIDPLFGAYDKGKLYNFKDRAVMTVSVKAIQELEWQVRELQHRLDVLEAKGATR